ncbi:hypothetical protein F4780DRAFT_688772 [Xylariomycetidae sp. FL0641]|nr:hypothetical protein F4780DRAFT_688772 [Xylariomycetidae sp. FL0641]
MLYKNRVIVLLLSHALRIAALVAHEAYGRFNSLLPNTKDPSVFEARPADRRLTDRTPPRRDVTSMATMYIKSRSPGKDSMHSRPPSASLYHELATPPSSRRTQLGHTYTTSHTATPVTAARPQVHHRHHSTPNTAAMCNCLPTESPNEIEMDASDPATEIPQYESQPRMTSG